MALDPRLQWRCEPPSWTVDPAAGRLIVIPAAVTDFWQRTHYGFRADNGHFLHASISQGFRMTVRVTIVPRHQYDQAGLMVRLSPDCWLKTSVEFEPGMMSRLGAVVTNGGYSDWSTQDVPGDLEQYWLRVDREGSDYVVTASFDGEAWTQLRVARLLEDDGQSCVLAGVYACCPKESGLKAAFEEFSIQPERRGAR